MLLAKSCSLNPPVKMSLSIVAPFHLARDSLFGLSDTPSYLDSTSHVQRRKTIIVRPRDTKVVDFSVASTASASKSTIPPTIQGVAGRFCIPAKTAQGSERGYGRNTKESPIMFTRGNFRSMSEANAGTSANARRPKWH